MAPPPEQSFDGAGAIFNEYAKTLRGHIRYEIVHKNLEPFLTLKPMRILDVGGGNGIDTAWLVMKGHHVTLLDSSQTQCQSVTSKFNFLFTTAERKLATIVCGSFEDLPTSPKKYDMVLLHGVAMYYNDPSDFIRLTASYVKKGGMLSLLEKGYYGTEYRIIQQWQDGQLKALHSRQRHVNHTGLRAYAFKPEQLENLVASLGFELIEWSGVRLITEPMFEQIADLDASLLKDIVAAEYRHGHNPGIRAQGQMLHFICRKP